VSSAIRILLRHGLLRDDMGVLSATRPPAGAPSFDPHALERRAEVERSKLRKMVEYAYHPRCRRQFILSYFGDDDWISRDQRCDGCDNCRGVGQAQPLSEEQQWHVRGILAVVTALKGRFGRTKLAAVANGTDDDHRLYELEERGILRGQSSRYLMDLMRSLDGAGLLETSSGEYPTISITRAGKDVLAGTRDLDAVSVLVPGRKPKRSRSRKKKPVVVAENLDSELVERLRTTRSRLASEKNVPAYVIFSNRTLEEIAVVRPTTRDELMTCHGIGASRLEAYGDDILAAIEG
jgi:ATP-dependent DNA helicase RecQ